MTKSDWEKMTDDELLAQLRGSAEHEDGQFDDRGALYAQGEALARILSRKAVVNADVTITKKRGRRGKYGKGALPPDAPGGGR